MRIWMGKLLLTLLKPKPILLALKIWPTCVLAFTKPSPCGCWPGCSRCQSYVSTSYQNIVYVRVERAFDDSCYDTTSFYLNIFDTPLTLSVTDWQVCDDDNDGQYAFDLTEKLSEIQAGNNGISVTFHTSSNDAELD